MMPRYLFYSVLIIIPWIASGLDTEFTSSPDSTVYVEQGKSVYLNWTYTLSTSDAPNFQGIEWMIYKDALNKVLLLTITKTGSVIPDDSIPAAYSGKVHWVGSTSNLARFKLSNVQQDMTVEKLASGLYINPSGVTSQRTSNPVSIKIGVKPIVTLQTSKTCVRGQPCTLQCSASGTPPPTFSWTNGQSNELSNQANYTISSSVQRSDSGLYTCKATNVLGSDQKNINLKVTYLDFNSQSSSGTTSTWNGHVTKLKCVASGEPTPTFNWRNPNGQIIIQGVSTPQPGTSVLTFTPQQGSDYGDYKCQANNDAGQFIHDIQVNQINLPGAPSNINTEPSAYSVKVTWSPPGDDGGSPITKYTLNISKVGINTWTPHDINPPLETYDVSGLDKSTEYRIRITAWNIVGQGPDSVKVIVKTLDEGPPDSPSILNSETRLTSNELTLKWSKPQNGGHPITKYSVVWEKKNLNEKKSKDVDGSDNLGTDVELFWGSINVVTVYAHNIRGRSTPGENSTMEFSVGSDPNAGARGGDDSEIEPIVIAIIILVVFLCIATPLLIFLLWKRRNGQSKGRKDDVDMSVEPLPPVSDEGYESVRTSGGRKRPEGAYADVNRNQPEPDVEYAAVNRAGPISPVAPEAQYAIVDKKKKKKKPKKKGELVYADLQDLTPHQDSPKAQRQDETNYAAIVPSRPTVKQEDDYANIVQGHKPKPKPKPVEDSMYANVSKFI